MKKLIIGIVILILLYLASYLYFGGFLIGYRAGYPVVYTYACADVCPQQGSWYKKYYGNLSYDQCILMNGEPKLVGLIMPDANGKPGQGSIGGYDGCRVK